MPDSRMGVLLDEFSRWHQLWRDAGLLRMLRDWPDCPAPEALTWPKACWRWPTANGGLTNLLHLADCCSS